MLPDSLHCTAHVSEGSDERFEGQWSKKPPVAESLNLPYIFWTKNAAAVSVSQSQKEVFDGTAPHSDTLAKPVHWEWKDLGSWLCRQQSPRGFRPVEEGRKVLDRCSK